MEVFAQGMGIATGLAIDGDENVYVGDRTGTVFKISPDRKISSSQRWSRLSRRITWLRVRTGDCT